MKNKLKDIVRQAIDIHLHIGPEIIPRRYTVETLVAGEKEKLGGAVLKNHFYPTQPFVNEVKNKKGLILFGAIALNNSVGGMNPEGIYASSLLSDKPITVWFPTINAENFLQKSEFEIAPEWVRKNGFTERRSKDVKPVLVTKNGKLTKESVSVLKSIKKYNAVLATGHISWKESRILVDQAIKEGVKQIVITHPIYQYINMPTTVQKELAKKGCFIEQSYSMYSIDKIPISRIAKQIKVVGNKSIILSSDVGQAFNLTPSQALLDFADLLSKEGITENELFEMLVVNPKKLFMMSRTRYIP